MNVVSVVGVEGVVSVGYNRLYRVIILHIQMFLSGFAVLSPSRPPPGACPGLIC